MLTDLQITDAIGRLSTLRYFPANPYGVRAIAEILKECDSTGKLNNIVAEFTSSHDDWPGPKSLREAVVEFDRQRYERPAFDCGNPQCSYGFVARWYEADSDAGSNRRELGFLTYLEQSNAAAALRGTMRCIFSEYFLCPGCKGRGTRHNPE